MIDRPAWQRFLYKIWPSIRRFINDVITLLEKILMSAIRTTLKQIKQI